MILFRAASPYEKTICVNHLIRHSHEQWKNFFVQTSVDCWFGLGTITSRIQRERSFMSLNMLSQKFINRAISNA